MGPVRVETLLPLGKLDPGLRAAETPLDLGRVIEDARLVETLGYLPGATAGEQGILRELVQDIRRETA